MENQIEHIKSDTKNGTFSKECEESDIMENEIEHIKNGNFVEKCAESDININELYIKLERDQTHSQSDPISTSPKIVKLKKEKCQICFKSFGSKTKLKIHMRYHTGERPYSCDKCPKLFTTKIDLDRHISIHTGEKPFQCDECGKYFRYKGLLTSHKRSHIGERLYSCHICGKACATTSNLKDHIKTHTGEKEFMCDQCDYATVHRSNLKAHIIRVHTIGEKTRERKFQCDDCGKAFSRSHILKRHRRVHTGERPYMCEECSEAFISEEACIIHKGKEHRGVADFLCNICSKTFFDPISLQKHTNHHKRNNGEVVKKFHCKQCGKSFKTNDKLETHTRFHMGERPYVCNECGKDFTKSSNLKVHILIHSGETPFKCTECHIGFRELIPLQKHMLNIHGIEYKQPTSVPPVSPSLSVSQFTRPPLSSEKPYLHSHTPQHMVPFVLPSPPLDTQNLEHPIPPPGSETQIPKTDILIPPEKNLPQPLVLNPRSSLLLDPLLNPRSSLDPVTEDESKGLSNLEDISVAPCPTSTIPCAKESIFSEVNIINSVGRQDIKIEPIEFNGDELNHEKIEADTTKDATGVDSIKLEIECKDNNEYSVANQNVKMELSGIDSDEEKIDSHISLEKIESTKNNNEDKKNNDKGKKLHKCETCFKTFAEITQLRIHTRTHTGERPYSCDECDYKCSVKGNLTKHIKYVHRKEPPSKPIKKNYICEICSKAFKRELELGYHMGKVHGDKNAPIRKLPHECNECDYKCSNAANLKKHIHVVHTNERPFKCELCPKTYKVPKDLNYHMKMAHEIGNTKQVLCVECGKSYKSEVSLRQHKLYYHPAPGDEQKYFYCDQCDYKSRFKANTTKHVENCHSNERLQCEFCPNTYSCKETLHYHVASVHHTGNSGILCEDCGKPCPTKRHLRLHKSVCPKGIKPICDECGDVFANQRTLKEHKMQHSGNKPFMCDHCSRAFIRQWDLKKHLQDIHKIFPGGEKSHIMKNKNAEFNVQNENHNETKFSCEDCGESFTDMRYLQKHYDSKQWACDKCDKTFSQVINLNIHKTLHGESQSFVCDDCSETFTSKSKLTTHMDKHHAVFPFACDKCGQKYRQFISFKKHKCIECSQCLETFLSWNKLNKHVRDFHENVPEGNMVPEEKAPKRRWWGSKTVECNICPKTFSTNNQLKVHTVLHTGERPYKCHICERAFAWKKTMEKHIEKHEKGSLDIDGFVIF